MEIKVNFVFFEELREKPDSNVTETRIMILRESKDVDSALDSTSEFDSPE
jgi:hypothetical protein